MIDFNLVLIVMAYSSLYAVGFFLTLVLFGIFSIWDFEPKMIWALVWPISLLPIIMTFIMYMLLKGTLVLLRAYNRRSK